MNKKLLVAIVIAASCAAIQWKPLADFYVTVYPSNPAKQEALHRCAAADKNFNRLNSDARAACYQKADIEPMPVGAPVALVATGSAANQVDLRRAAGQGTAPRNDVRLVQQSDGSKR